jgi:hypothetical protein
MTKTHLTTLGLSLLVTACVTDDDDAGTELTGRTTYRDAATDHAGAAHEPSAPPPQSARVNLVIRGNGQIPQVDPQCALDPAGQFEAHYLGTAQMSGGNGYAALVARGSGALQTPSGCTIPDLTVGVITDVIVRGELAINSQNCETYCTASARADAEQACGASASAASCRADAEVEAAARCTQTCTTQASHIRAEVSLATALFTHLDAAALRAAAFGAVHADLMFDHLVDASGTRL